MYGDDQTTQQNSLLLTSLLVEALANSNSTTIQTTPTGIPPITANTLFQPDDASTPNFLVSTPVVASRQISSTSPPQLLMNQTALNQILLLNSALQQDLRLSQATGTFHLNDDGSESSRSTTAATTQSPLETPLDLTTRKLSTHIEEEPSTSTPRSSVIKNSFPLKPRTEPGIRNCVGVKRSTSSLSYRPATDSDVSDHFRRSLSGKWPRRPINYSHYTINSNRIDSTPSSRKSSVANTSRVTSPITSRRQTTTLGSNSCVSHMIIGGETEVEEHFRRTFELLRQNADSKKEPPSQTTTRL